MTWVWREESDLDTNHDLMYAYSTNNAISWRNNAGVEVAATPEAIANPIVLSKPGIKVWDIPQNSRLVNQGGQFVAADGQVHVVLTQILGNYIHYYRNVSGEWFRRDTGVLAEGRGKIVADDFDAYILAGSLRILCATGASNFTDWQVVSSQD